jgi:hypothetical protein
MSYVAAAYLAIACLMAIYVYTLVARQRLIAELAEAADRTDSPWRPSPRRSLGARGRAETTRGISAPQ